MPRDERDTGPQADRERNPHAGTGDSHDAIDTLCTTLLAIDAALSPIIGARGVTALYQRSLHLTAATHGVLADVRRDDHQRLDLGPLGQALAGEAPAEVKLVGDALLQSFHQVLASLIGPSLTERLLRSVGTDPSSGSAAQDPPP